VTRYIEPRNIPLARLGNDFILPAGGGLSGNESLATLEDHCDVGDISPGGVSFSLPLCFVAFVFDNFQYSLVVCRFLQLYSIFPSRDLVG
jgi:hypothetical protein